MRKRLQFNDNWHFAKTSEVPEALYVAGSDSDWICEKADCMENELLPVK